jgi:uncharacterized protein
VAELEVEGDELVLRMTTLEKVEGVHGDIRVPLSTVRVVRAVPNPWHGAHLRGMRAPGTGLPNTVMVGTRRGGFGKDFAAVHGTGPAVVVDLAGAEYHRLVVTDPDAEGVASRLRAATEGTTDPS